MSHESTRKVGDFASLLQDIRELDPTAPGAREKLASYRIKIVSAYQEIDSFLKNAENVDDEAKKTVQSRLESLANIYQSVRQLEDILDKNIARDGNQQEEEETQKDIGDEIASLQKDFVTVYEQIQKCVNSGEKDTSKVHALMKRLTGIQTRLLEVEKSMKTQAAKEIPSEPQEKRLEELGSILLAIQERYQAIASELQDLHQSKDPDRDAVERLTSEMSELSEIASKVRSELETIRDVGVMQEETVKEEKAPASEAQTDASTQLKLAYTIASQCIENMQDVKEKRQFLHTFFRNFQSPLQNDDTSRNLLVESMLPRTSDDDDDDEQQQQQDSKTAEQNNKGELSQILHEELDMLISRTGRSSDFMFLVLSELKHFPIEDSKFRLDFLQSCENLRDEVDRARQKASIDASEWSVQRNRVTRRSFDYAEDVDGDDDEDTRVIEDMYVISSRSLSFSLRKFLFLYSNSAC